MDHSMNLIDMYIPIRFSLFFFSAHRTVTKRNKLPILWKASATHEIRLGRLGMILFSSSFRSDSRHIFIWQAMWYILIWSLKSNISNIKAFSTPNPLFFHSVCGSGGQFFLLEFNTHVKHIYRIKWLLGMTWALTTLFMTRHFRCILISKH